MTKNKDIKFSSLKSSENTKKKEGGPDSAVSKIQFSSVTLNELAMNAREREHAIISSFREAVNLDQNNTNLFRIY